MTTTRALPGYGSKFFMSATGVAGSFTPIAQLQSWKPQGSKQTILDQTNLLTADVFDRPMATRVVGGEIDLTGVLDPQNTGILQLGQAHASCVPYFFLAQLPDGTQYTFQGLVSEYVPFDVPGVTKAIGFTAKIRLSGAYTGPAGQA